MAARLRPPDAVAVTNMNDNENVPKIVEALQQHQLKKVLERAKAGKDLTRSDLHLVEQIGSKFDAPRTPPVTESAPQKPKRGRPPKMRQMLEEIELDAVEQLRERLKRGEKLTGADYWFIERTKQATVEQADASKKNAQPAKLPLAERLQESKEVAFESLRCVMEHSKSDMARVSAAQTVEEWADQEEPPLEPYKFVLARPQDVKLTKETPPLPDRRSA